MAGCQPSHAFGQTPPTRLCHGRRLFFQAECRGYCRGYRKHHGRIILNHVLGKEPYRSQAFGYIILPPSPKSICLVLEMEESYLAFFDSSFYVWLTHKEYEPRIFIE